jgi:hypothetical protein
MIVRPNGATQLLITQPDHAALAGRVMRQWAADALAHAPNRPAILTAIDEHDNGWREVDAAPIVDGAGRILDFIATPDDIRREIWPRGIQRLAPTPYAAALVAQHASHIYDRYRTDPGWARFFASMESTRNRHLLEAGRITLDDLLRDYLFLRVGDMLSLTFCNGWTQVQTDDVGSGYSMRLERTRLIVTPDPFEGREIPLEITARELPNHPLRSAAEARKVFQAAPVVVLQGVACGA